MGKIIPVILSGGAGSRLWPLSRTAHPKQFLSLYSDQSLFQETLKRLCALPIQIDPAIIICNEAHRFLVAQHVKDMDIPTPTILLEPMGRNTAPAIAAAALKSMENGDDPILLVLPADHIIGDQAAFAAAMQKAIEGAQTGALVTFGIKPLGPHTGYGYIERGAEISPDVFEIKAFKEKPDLQTAQKFLDSQTFFWNSGMFVFRAGAYLAALEGQEPELLNHVHQSLSRAVRDDDFIRLASDSFGACKSISIDYAVMERTKNGMIVKMDAAWCDVGSWDALWQVIPKDENGNACRGDVMMIETRGSYINANTRMVCTIGLDDIIVIETKECVLVGRRKDSEKIKTLVETLKSCGREDLL